MNKLRRAQLALLQQQTAALPKMLSECGRCGVAELTRTSEPDFMCDPCAAHIGFAGAK